MKLEGRKDISMTKLRYDVDGDGDLDALCCEEVDQLGVFWYEIPISNNPHLGNTL